MARIPTYAEFWPYYLNEHSVPSCRVLHFIGTSGHFAMVAVAVATMNPWWLLASAFFAYGFAWFGHFVIEKNRPATFTHPLWSLVSDYQMWGHMLMGKLWSGTNPAEQVASARSS